MNNQEKLDHYVYVLVDKHDCYRYIGMGRLKRYKRTQGRSDIFMEILKDCGKFEFLHENLSRKDAYKLESEYLKEHLGKTTDKWNLINLVTNRGKTLDTSFELLDKYVYLDTTSPTGLRWKIDARDYKELKGCSTIRVGAVAGWLNRGGYGGIQIEKRTIPIHRAIWSLYHRHDIPWNIVVNHIDSNTSNNHVSNLELATFSDNSKKKKKQHDNTTGVTGVSFCKTQNWMVAHIYIDCKRKDKYFSIDKYGRDLALEKAVAWRKEMESIHYTSTSVDALNAKFRVQDTKTPQDNNEIE